jgi:hypothetical protein
MHALKVDYHLSTGIAKHGFMAMSDKLREQLIEQGYAEDSATMDAPVMLKGLVMAREGSLDVRRMRYELDQKRKPRNDPGFGFAPDAPQRS